MYIEERDVGGGGEGGEAGASDVPQQDVATPAEQQTPKKESTPAK